jgi:hypothetical protein
MASLVGDPAATKLRSQIAQFTRTSGIAVSPAARQVIAVVLDAMRRDPHPNWSQADRAKVMALRSQILGDLPTILAQIAKAEHAAAQLSSFDVLHWLADNFTSWCPVDK